MGRRPALRLPAWHVAALLGLALIGPAALPAGGADPRRPELRRRRSGEPLLAAAAGKDAALRCSPHHCAPALKLIEAGEPLRLLRTWWEPGGRRWLQVQAAAAPGEQRRGWLAG